jgi:hypothetical protein
MAGSQEQGDSHSEINTVKAMLDTEHGIQRCTDMRLSLGKIALQPKHGVCSAPPILTTLVSSVSREISVVGCHAPQWAEGYGTSHDAVSIPRDPSPDCKIEKFWNHTCGFVKVESPSTLYIEDFGLQCARNVGLSVEFIAPMILRSRAPIQHRHHRWLYSTAGNEVVQIKAEV